MKIRNSLISLLLVLGSVYARATSVTATITDTDTTVWGNCKWAVRLNNPRPDIVPSVGGTPLTAGQLNQSGVCNSSGVMSLTLVDNTTINIFGTTWQFTITPNASSNSGVASAAVSGASQSLSTFLSGIVPVVRFSPGPGAYGYADAEVIGSLLPGAVYFNTTPTAIQRIWSGTAWANNGGGSGGSPAFSAITSGTNTGQGLVVGAGSVFTTASNGVINANEIGGVLLSGLGTGLYKFTAGVPTLAVAGDFPTLNQSTTGNAATATALAANPTDCGGGQFANAIDAQGNLTCATPSGGGTPAFPVTVTGGVSGGIPYFNSTTQESASAAGTVNTLMKWGGAGNPPIASSVTDNGTTVSTTESISTPGVNTTGSNNGFYNFAFNSSSATAPTTHNWQISPNIDVTIPWSFSPSAAPFTGLMYLTNTSSIDQLSQATGTNVSSVIQGLTGCNTATFVFTPQANDCVAPSGGSSGTPLINTGLSRWIIPLRSGGTSQVGEALTSITTGGSIGDGAPSTTAPVFDDFNISVAFTTACATGCIGFDGANVYVTGVSGTVYQFQLNWSTNITTNTGRYFAGLCGSGGACSVTNIGKSDSPSGQGLTFVGLRYSTIAGDTAPVCITSDGTTTHTYTPSPAITPAQYNKFELDDNGTSWTLKANGTAVCSAMATNIPASATQSHFVSMVTPNTANAIHSLFYGFQEIGQ